MNADLMSSTSRLTIVRASSLSWFADCPRRWAANHLKIELELAGFRMRTLPRGIGASIGTAVHAAAAQALTDRAEGKPLPPESVAGDVARDAVVEDVRKGVAWDRSTKTESDAVLQATRMARAYRRVIAPTVNPILVEKRLEAQVTPSIVISGQQDVLAREPGTVRDLKTGTQRGNHKPQLGAYSLLARTDNHDVVQVKEDFIQRVGIKHPQPDPEVFPHDIAAAETAAINVLRHIEGDLTVFRRGDASRGLLAGDPWAFAANPSSKLCGEKYCPAFGTDFCREHKEKEDADD